MERRDNYAIQAAHARSLFLQYDPIELAEKLNTSLDQEWLYTCMLSEEYRINRENGHIQRKKNEIWIAADSFVETLTLFDLVCDSRMDRRPANTWKDTRDFGHQFHQKLLEDTEDVWALRFQEKPIELKKICKEFNGQKFPNGDIAFTVPFFDSLSILIQFWMGDDEFPPKLRWLWDANADMYIRYETMYYAIGLIKSRMTEILDSKQAMTGNRAAGPSWGAAEPTRE